MTALRGTTARLLLALAVFGVAFVAYALLARETPETGATGNGEVVNVEVNYAFEPTDKKQLVGFATHVFVGRVVEKVGAEGAPLSGPGNEVMPRTQFSVAVLEGIKEDLGGEVTVSQTGGYDASEDRVVRVEGDPLLQPGQQRLFVTSYDGQEDWYTMVAQPFGDVRIESQRTDLVEKFERARRAQEVPLELAADR